MNAENNSNVNPPQKPERRSRIADVLVVVFCVSGAAFSLNLFRLDLFQSIASQNKKPMGAVTVKYNNVQRRFSDRVLWDRLTVDSPVYLGDLIRVAEYSAATLNINDGIIDINENSLIRIRTSSDGENRVVIDMSSGSLSITGSDAADSGGATGVALSVKGRVIAPAAGATLSASAGESGMTLQVNKGSVIIKEEDGQSRSMEAGEALILDTKGVEMAAPAAVVTLPRPNARFIKDSAEPLNIRFVWNAINIDPKQPLRLDIASGPNFSRIVQTAEGIDFSNVALGAGTWYWRLSYQNTVLSSGQFTVIDASMSAPKSPLKDSTGYRENMPIRFEWQPVEGASYYILEAGLTPDIIYPSITRQTAVASYVESNMGAGTWYWHVKPVFPSLYEGVASFSQVSSFKIDKPVVAVQTADNSSATPASLSNPGVSVISSIEWVAYTDKTSKANNSIAVEKIDGIEKEVLTINAHLGPGTQGWAGAGTGADTTNMNFISKIKNADGVRFKVLGDGKKWRIYFAASNVTDGAYHGLTIPTKKGKVSAIDIPFNKLNQPDWAQRKIRFNKNNIQFMNIESNHEISGTGTSTIKVFDFELYQSANAPSTELVTPSGPDTAAPASSISNPDFAVISQAVKWEPTRDGSSKSSCNIARETIDGIEREVLTIDINLAGGSSKNAGASTHNTDVVQKLKNAGGVRFKAVGDGKKWSVRFSTSDVASVDGAYYRLIILTKKGEVGSFDVPFSKLTQPEYVKYPKKFNKNNITELNFEKNDYTGGGTGAATLKVFDFEIYQTANAPSAELVTASGPDTAASAGSVLKPDEIISPTAGWAVYKDSSSMSNFTIAKETIGGIEREVLTIDVNLRGKGTGGNNFAGSALMADTDAIQKLRKANGVRFKVLGDGKKWNIRFVTSDVKNYAFHISSISNTKDKVSNIDISFDKLRQPDWNNTKVKYNKNNLNEFIIERNVNDGAGNIGASTIKIFDFEIY